MSCVRRRLTDSLAQIPNRSRGNFAKSIRICSYKPAIAKLVRFCTCENPLL
jgi:hypothetical protein